MNEMSVNTVLPMYELTAFMKSRANFTLYHLLAAKNASFIATEIENKYKSESPSQKERDIYLSQVSTAIICSVAALESNINEYLVDHEKHLSGTSVNFDKKVIKKYPRLNKGLPSLSQYLLRSTCIIFKYDIVWFIAKKDLLPENKLKRDIRYLTRLRNALTHFTPEWDDALSKHVDLEKDRKNRFKLNPFYPTGGLFFPYLCLSASCARWSCRVSNEFIALFKAQFR
jgi:hypothetical protein